MKPDTTANAVVREGVTVERDSLRSPISEIVGVREIVFEDTGVERPVMGDCKVCMRAREVYGEGVVAPSGLAHIVPSYGDRTLCGKDATGNGWWWAL